MVINEEIVTGRAHRILIDRAAKLWRRLSYWTKASDVEFNDGKSAEAKLGAINGITDSLASPSSGMALSAAAGNNLQQQIHSVNTSLGGLKFVSCTQAQYDALGSGRPSNTIYFIS